MRKFIALALAAFATSSAATPPLAGPPPPAPPPRLLIVISVDQLSSDLFDEYRPMMFGGFGRLARGTTFRNGYQAHAATETCPGHSTILTGAHPARNGVIANGWVDQSQTRSDKSVYCAEDESVAGSSSSSYTVSPVHLKVRTLGEQLKAKWAGSQNVAVGGKDRSAVMMGGGQVDQRWYWDSKRFSTDQRPAAISPSVTRANAVVAAMIAAAQPPLDPPELCRGKARPFAIEGTDRTVGDGRFARAAGDAAAFRASPAFDGALLALAAGLIEDLKLGQDTAPDVLSIGLAATDYVGHSFGTGGQEMCLQLLSLDRDLGDFFRMLDQRGIDYAVALTADHGGQDIPERLRAKGIQSAQRVDAALAASAIGKAVGAKLGISGPVLIGDYIGDIYIDRAIRTADRPRVLREALARYRAHPQVEAAFSADQLRRTPMPTGTPDRWTMIERARASFDPQRSGDIVVLLKRYVTPIRGSRTAVATHGSPWDYDRRVPIMFWRPGMPATARSEHISTVDIMPTLAAMLGLAVDASSIDGTCLSGISGIACPPR